MICQRIMGITTSNISTKYPDQMNLISVSKMTLCLLRSELDTDKKKKNCPVRQLKRNPKIMQLIIRTAALAILETLHHDVSHNVQKTSGLLHLRTSICEVDCYQTW